MVLKILYIHHHPHIGGSSKSLIELLQIIKNKKKIEIDIISPNGSALEKIKNLKINYYAFLGIPIFDNSNWGYYKGFRWIVLIREIFNFIFFYFQIKRIKKKYDIIHINEILCFPVLGILKKQFNSKIILHQRTRLNKSKNLRIKIMNRIIEKYADKIISIDNFCFQTLSTKLKKKAKIIHNGLNTNKVIIKNNKKKYTNIGFVGPLRESKGIYLLINSYLKYFQNFKNVRLLIFSHKPKKNYFHKFLNFFNIRDYFYDYYIKKNF